MVVVPAAEYGHRRHRDYSLFCTAVKNFLLLLLIFCCDELNAQHKLVFRKGMKRVVLKTGHAVGVTQKGEPFAFENWNSVCNGCYLDSCMDSLYSRRQYFDSTYFYYRDCADTNCLNNIWTLEAVTENSIVLRTLPADSSKYRYDTVRVEQYGRYQRRAKKKHEEYFSVGFDSVVENSGAIGYRYIMLVPIDYDRKTVPPDSIASFTFHRADQCATFDLGTPLLALVAAIGSPIAAAQKDDFGGKYGWPLVIAGEALAGGLTVLMVRNVNSLRVRTYDLAAWKVKAR
jgi:hypothetical protein